MPGRGRAVFEKNPHIALLGTAEAGPVDWLCAPRPFLDRRAGPTARAALVVTLFRPTASRSRSGPTTSGTRVCLVGCRSR
ncbi:hypothetical protein [Streptomyces sp. SID685]|uniref:hypothetical protein n=1 Tax=Streptomyces sp. SID685 TaxID=2690322 RepID=UPI001F38C0DE|nr:hypothetical protein [Streptomyces sp. SID685]